MVAANKKKTIFFVLLALLTFIAFSLLTIVSLSVIELFEFIFTLFSMGDESWKR